MSEEDWNKSGFPFFNLPAKIETHVNTGQWQNRCTEMENGNFTKGSVKLMKSVLENLTKGCDSQVGPPGNSPSITENAFIDPTLDIPRIADALAIEVSNGHMAGPFPINHILDAKVNGFLSIVKPTGARRQVGNLSAPKGRSFNEGINPVLLHEWKVTQTTSKHFSDMISRSGKNSIMSCSDMVSAYKCLPVCIKQRRLQVFSFPGKEFIDLRLIFWR